MTNAPAPSANANSNDGNRNGMLNDIGTKWSKFSKQELSDLKTNDDLVTLVVAKYGLAKAAAQRDVDTLMHGRKLTA
jgi:hypothetical protein